MSDVYGIQFGRSNLLNTMNHEVKKVLQYTVSHLIDEQITDELIPALRGITS